MTGLTVQDQRDIDIIWKELEEWSDVNNYDFQIVCGFSEFNPSIIKKVIVYCVENAETIEKGQKWNDIIRSTLQSNQSPKDS